MKKVEGLLGLCRRCGQITLGADLTLREVRAGRAALVLVDADAAPGTAKKLRDACDYRHVRLHVLPPGVLARACGQEERVAAAIRPGPLCAQIRDLLSTSGNTDDE